MKRFEEVRRVMRDSFFVFVLSRDSFFLSVD